MEPRIIKTGEQHRNFLAEIERPATLDLDPESTQGLRLELLAKLVEDYEQTRFAFAKRDPIDAILFRMEQQGLKQKHVAPYLGGKNRALEVLSTKRSLRQTDPTDLAKRIRLLRGPLVLLDVDLADLAFTDHGVIIAASVLNSPHAVETSIDVVRAFVKLREALPSDTELVRKIEALEKSVATLDAKTREQFEEVYRAIGKMVVPPAPTIRPDRELH